MKKRNPEWEYSLFDARKAMDFIAQEFEPELLQAFKDIRLPAMLSDVFRVAWILKKGGIYIDIAAKCLNPIDSWIGQDLELVLLIKKQLGWPYAHNTLIYSAAPGHPIIVEVWAEIERAILRREGDSVWNTTGPGVFGKVFSGQPEQYKKYVIPLEAVSEHFKLGSSSTFLPKDRHWSVRQRIEGLYETDAITLMLG